jgi:hypothetical protein
MWVMTTTPHTQHLHWTTAQLGKHSPAVGAREDCHDLKKTPSSFCWSFEGVESSGINLLLTGLMDSIDI